MRVHLVGVAGTGMGQLAILFRDAGHDVSGSDASFDPPMGPALDAAGIRCLAGGYKAEHIDESIDLVVVGNAIRKDNVEAVRAIELNRTLSSMSGALRERFLIGKRPLVVAGTHGKTTTSAMCAWILECAGLEPGFFIGGLPKNFGGSFTGARAASSKRKIIGTTAKPAPFVIEGDEYDAVYWHKKPKFFDYVGISNEDVAIVTSVEHDHIDIYPSAEVYEAQFAELAQKIPADGLLVCDAHDKRARAIVVEHSRSARTSFYALDGDDTGDDVTPTWLGALVPADVESGAQPFDLYIGGSSCGRFALKVPGAHNVRNAIAAIAACAEGFGVDVEKARQALASFEGVRRRQDLLGQPNNIAIYDDFAHHPTAVDETLRALRSRHPSGKLFAVFEPRSATACRNLHQEEYTRAFAAADRVLFAPLGRSNVPESERLDLDRLSTELGAKSAAMPSVDAILETIVSEAKSGDVIALLSNGAFGGIHERLLLALGTTKSDIASLR
jgi:UDP-N-acetylmuramate: L-alanyl-gamma-D-glutamyl-meso-diaminopimelate ligase